MPQTASSSDKIRDRTEILTLNGECDLSTAFHAEQQIISALDSGTTEIIFDLRGVTSLGRPMLHVLFRALIRIGQKGRLVLVRPNAHVWTLFEDSGMDKVFSTFADLSGALAEVSSRSSQGLSSRGLSHPADVRRRARDVSLTTGQGTLMTGACTRPRTEA
jgi:anti-anti-sigma factor